jgi:hypothetical protein
MGIFFSILFFLTGYNSQPEPADISYWENNEGNTHLAQIIHTPDDQGRDVLHINVFLSSSCTSEIYYAMPLEENNLYVLTDTFGNVVESEAHISIRNKKNLKFQGQNFKKISKVKYFSEMKLFEKSLNE